MQTDGTLYLTLPPPPDSRHIVRWARLWSNACTGSLHTILPMRLVILAAFCFFIHFQLVVLGLGVIAAVDTIVLGRNVLAFLSSTIDSMMCRPSSSSREPQQVAHCTRTPPPPGFDNVFRAQGVHIYYAYYQGTIQPDVQVDQPFSTGLEALVSCSRTSIPWLA